MLVMFKRPLQYWVWIGLLQGGFWLVLAAFSLVGMEYGPWGCAVVQYRLELGLRGWLLACSGIWNELTEQVWPGVQALHQTCLSNGKTLKGALPDSPPPVRATDSLKLRCNLRADRASGPWLGPKDVRVVLVSFALKKDRACPELRKPCSYAESCEYVPLCEDPKMPESCGVRAFCTHIKN